MSKEIYISTDIEADGPIPGLYSMLSLGSAAYLPDKTLVDTFMANLEPLPDASQDPATMKWWEKNPDAWAGTQVNQRPASDVMTEYLAWVKSLPGKPIFVGYPVAYDFMFVQWYLYRFTGDSPFSHSALDMKTLSMALLKSEYRTAAKKYMPDHWFDHDLPHTHSAVDDAVEQGALFCNMLMELHGVT